jgi:hypothetical protein
MMSDCMRDIEHLRLLRLWRVNLPRSLLVVLTSRRIHLGGV